MIGLKTGTVKIDRYSGKWQVQFNQEQRRLHRTFGNRRHLLEHIGSTSVPGLAAKPIVDMALMIPSLRRLPLWIRDLEKAGYTYKGEYGLTDRHFFTLGNPVTTHHLHLVARGSEHWTRWMLFRDYLRAHPAEAEQYNAVKKNLARKFAKNRAAYTHAKTPFINRLLRRAAKWDRSTAPR